MSIAYQQLKDVPFMKIQQEKSVLQASAGLRYHPNQMGSGGEENVTFFGDFDIQYLEEAEGAVVNMDYFPVVIDRLPNNPNTGQQFTADGFLEYIRTNINDFVDNNYSQFTPSEETGFNESAIWDSNNPLGGIVHINIPGAHDGSVVCSDYNITSTGSDYDYWIFTTLEMPWGVAQGLDGPHPVSGNREFGYSYDPNDGPNGSYTFYVKGVDRFESQIDYDIADYMETGQPFNGADNLWTSFQQKLQNFCNDIENNDVANVAPQSISRPNWTAVKDVLLEEVPISNLGCN